MAINAQIKIAEDIRQSPEYGEYLKKIGWEVTVLDKSKVQVFIRRLGPVSLMKIQRAEQIPDPDELKPLFSRQRVFMCKIEPSETIPDECLDSLKKQGFRPSNWPLLGTKTSRVNILPDVHEIFSGFKKDCRYCIRKVEEKNIDSVKFDDPSEFYCIWKESAKRKKIWIPSRKDYFSLISAFGNKALTLTAGGLAGAVILIHEKTAFYYYAGSTAEGVKSNLPYLIVWAAMKEAKKRGCAVWDFEGIYDERWPNKTWMGFSHFKKGFSGSEIEFPGSFERWRWPF